MRSEAPDDPVGALVGRCGSQLASEGVDEVVQGEAALPVPWLVREAMLTEARHILIGAPKGPTALPDMRRGVVVRFAFSLTSEADRVSQLLRTYASVPMALADGCALRMAGLLAGARAVALDRHILLHRMRGDRPCLMLRPTWS